MSKYFVIWGCAGHAKVLASIIKSQGGEVLALFDNRDVLSVIAGTPIYVGEAGFNKWASHTNFLSDINGIVAIGGNKGRDRIKIHTIFHKAGLMLPPLIHPSAFVCNTAFLGEGSQVLAQAVVAADSKIGISSIINHKASVDHECFIGNGAHIAPGATVCGCVKIGDNVLIGAGAVVLPRLKIGADSIIGAGAVVTKDVPERSIIIGNPGRPI